MQSLLWDFLRITESVAISVYPLIGSGNEFEVDRIATETIRKKLNEMNISGQIVIGEGEIDSAPMLNVGEKVGRKKELKIDIAVDPIEGTTPIVKGQKNGITVIAVAPLGTLIHAPDIYMKKIVVGQQAKGKIDIEAPFEKNLKNVATALNKQVTDLNIMIQDRSRHKQYIESSRKLGANVYLFEHNDIIPSILTNLDFSNIDMLFNIGGAPEGVISAVILKALDGEMQAKFLPSSHVEKERCKKMGITNTNKVFNQDDLVKSNKTLFVATGITDNRLISGVRKNNKYYELQSIIVDGIDGKLRIIKTKH